MKSAVVDRVSTIFLFQVAAKVASGLAGGAVTAGSGGSRLRMFWWAQALVIGLAGPHLTAHPVWADGVAFDVPATIQCLPLVPVPFEANPSSDKTVGPAGTRAGLTVNLASLSRHEGLAIGGDGNRLEGTRIYAIQLDVTVLFSEPGQYQSVMFELLPLSRNWRVLDYSPRSLAASDWDGGISLEAVQDRSSSLAGNLNAAVPGAGGFSLLIDGRDVASSVSRQQLKAPLVPVITSGLSQRGSGAFFKFNTSREFLIEGGHALELIVEVPAHWRGDVLRVHCLAKSENSVVRRDYMTAVTIAGDEEALGPARHFAAADHRIQELLRRFQVTHKRPSNLLGEVEQLLARRQAAPVIEKTRIQQGLVVAAKPEQVPHYSELPESLQLAINQFMNAKQDLLRLSRPPGGGDGRNRPRSPEGR